MGSRTRRERSASKSCAMDRRTPLALLETHGRSITEATYFPSLLEGCAAQTLSVSGLQAPVSNVRFWEVVFKGSLQHLLRASNDNTNSMLDLYSSKNATLPSFSVTPIKMPWRLFRTVGRPWVLTPWPLLRVVLH